jgi:hypothetical protein
MLWRQLFHRALFKPIHRPLQGRRYFSFVFSPVEYTHLCPISSAPVTAAHRALTRENIFPEPHFGLTTACKMQSGTVYDFWQLYTKANCTRPCPGIRFPSSKSGEFQAPIGQGINADIALKKTTRFYHVLKRGFISEIALERITPKLEFGDRTSIDI